ncbi:MAG: hypothetical protein ACYC5S_05035, partial [Thiobacillus sp.]
MIFGTRFASTVRQSHFLSRQMVIFPGGEIKSDPLKSSNEKPWFLSGRQTAYALEPKKKSFFPMPLSNIDPPF